MDFNSEGAEPRCRARDVDAEWWMDQDHERTELPEGHTAETWAELTKLERARLRRRQVDYGLAIQREDQMRAKFFCLECPLMMACREAGWQEGTHVWGGLDGGERFRILKSGSLSTIIQPLKSPYVGAAVEHDAVWMFKEGASIEEVADELGLKHGRVRDILRTALTVERVRREDEEGWRSQSELPQLPDEGMGRESYRIGRAVWSLSERESA